MNAAKKRDIENDAWVVADFVYQRWLACDADDYTKLPRRVRRSLNVPITRGGPLKAMYYAMDSVSRRHHWFDIKRQYQYN